MTGLKTFDWDEKIKSINVCAIYASCAGTAAHLHNNGIMKIKSNKQHTIGKHSSKYEHSRSRTDRGALSMGCIYVLASATLTLTSKSHQRYETLVLNYTS